MKKVYLSVPGGLFKIAFIAVGVIAMSSAPAGAAVLNVNNQAACSNTTGSPSYCTINAAMANAVAGDTVLVAAGTYHGGVIVTQSGTQNFPITITTNSGAVVKSPAVGFDISGASWVKIHGFTVYKTQSDGIRCVLCSNVRLSGNSVKLSNGFGISIRDSNDTVIAYNRVTGSRLTGIDVASSPRTSIKGGYVNYSGIQVSGGSYKGIKFSASSDSSVVLTKVHHNSDTGIYLLNGTTGVRIKDVVVHHNARGYIRSAAGIEARSPGNIVESATAYENEDSGINMRWGGSDALIVNNITYDNGDHGIDVLESPRPVIINNSVYANVTAGINVEGHSPGGLIMNNISVDNGIGSPRTLGDIRVTSTSTMGATADRNIVWGSDGGKIYQWNGIYFSNLSALQSANPGVETNGLEVDPAWVDPAGGDFHPSAVSAAIDSAASDAIGSPEIDQDSEGNTRCDDPLISDTGSGPISYTDRGALEHVSPC